MALTSGGGRLTSRIATLLCAATVIATLICSFRKPPSSRRSLRRTAAAVSLAVSSRWLHVAVQPEVVMHTKK